MKTAIYKITNPEGAVYIGQSRNIEKRWRKHRWKDIRNKTMMFKSIQSFGYDTHQFEILHELPMDVDQSVLDNYEDLYIKQYRLTGLSLNSKGGGRKGEIAEYHKEALRKSRIGIPSGMLGRNHTEEAKRKMGEKRKGRVFSEESKRKMSVGRLGIVPWNKGIKMKPRTEEQKRKSGEAIRRAYAKKREACNGN